jgi:hypothetical protein
MHKLFIKDTNTNKQTKKKTNQNWALKKKKKFREDSSKPELTTEKKVVCGS